eukprot:TRINITY_DN47318_c0_g1_i1.p1 TRINITY_DN47318_c0_g1~~TRINITY_DN47318_c0_g1_i1.p1  ORF type:complete len:392 (+),score=142.36 TRINITY_DN47318_c0_g1_i1:69-1244(+)
MEPAGLGRDLDAVFVARFDAKRGNVLEWSHPPSVQSAQEGTAEARAADALDLSGLEWKAIVSGWHAVTADFVLFQWHGLYGVAAYNSRQDSGAERGVWQRSAGLLCRHLYFVARHVEVLTEQARAVNAERLPGVDPYEGLRRYYVDCCCEPPPLPLAAGAGHTERALAPAHPALDRGSDVAVYMREVALAWGSAQQLARFLQEKVLLLWRCLLCRLRVLFVSRGGDVGVVCSLCNGAHALLGAAEGPPLVQPARLYYVSVSDIDRLKDIPFYVACTTERILEEKPQLWDALVVDREVRLSPALQRDLAKGAGGVDGRQWGALQGRMQGGAAEGAVAFFSEANEQLLHCARKWKGGEATKREVEELGLTVPAAKRVFAALQCDVKVAAGCCS